MKLTDSTLFSCFLFSTRAVYNQRHIQKQHLTYLSSIFQQCALKSQQSLLKHLLTQEYLIPFNLLKMLQLYFITKLILRIITADLTIVTQLFF